MMMNSKFEKAARSRRAFALWAAILLHVAVFGAIAFKTDIVELLPDFVKEYVVSPSQEVPAADPPQAFAN